MKEIILINCGSMKRICMHRAIDMYTGWYVRNCAFIAKKLHGNHENTYILSAKYGLLKYNERIMPYDVKMADMSEVEKIAWGTKVIERLKDEHPIDDSYYILFASQIYLEPIIKHLQHYIIPLKGIGMQFASELLGMVKKKAQYYYKKEDMQRYFFGGQFENDRVMILEKQRLSMTKIKRNKK